MKIINSFTIPLCGIMLATSCNDAKLAAITGGSDGDNRLYINEASMGESKSIYLSDDDNSGEEMLTARMVRPVEHEVKARLVIDDSLLKEYNKNYSTGYTAIEEQYIELGEVAIPAGSSSGQARISVRQFGDADQGEYAIPVRLVSDDLTLTEASSTFVIPVKKELVQKVWTMPQNKNGVKVENLNFDLQDWTLEWWVRSSAFPVNNMAIIDAGSGSAGDEIYVRFGDANPTPYSYLQIKIMGAEMMSNDPKTAPLGTNTWYHFAIVRNAGTAEISLYMNGQLVKTQASKGPGGTRFSRFILGNGSFKNANINMAQLRLWNVMRTQSQISASMRSNVKVDDETLVIYLKMDEGENTNGFKNSAVHGLDKISTLQILGGSWSDDETNFSRL